MSKLKRCPCLRPEEDEVTVLDYRHCSLEHVPSDVFTLERTLEELNIDANQIRELPRELFYCHGLRKLTLSDNEVISIPQAVSSLVNLNHLDVSKNGIVDLPDNIKACRQLMVIEASVNPMGKLPEGFTQLLSLSELYLNDTFLDYLPGSFGRLSKLKILELRENHLKTLPRSLSRLLLLERLDVGNNEFTELPEVVGGLPSLQELWCDSNQLTCLPKELGQLKNIMFLDASKNHIETLPSEIEGCINLADMHLSTNLLQQLPETLGRLSNLTTLKVDDNRLTSLPYSIGGLVSLSEMNISANDIEHLPPSIGLLRHLRTLYLDENFLMGIPPEMGSCSGLTVLSMRGNNLTVIPDEIGRIPRLRVLNLSDNKLQSLPFSFTRLQQLQALWLAENQTKPLIRLQSEIDPIKGRVLTCYLLPQQARDDREEFYTEADRDSFHPSMWEEEREKRQQIQFSFPDVPDQQSRLERTPTPYPKEMKHRIQHMRNLALKQLNIANGKTPEGRESKQKPEPCDQPVTGRRDSPERQTPRQTGVLATSPLKSLSPLMAERHHLFKADKEKMQKDKSRMVNHSTQSGDTNKRNHKNAEKSNQPSPDDDGGFLQSRRGSSNCQENDNRHSIHTSDLKNNEANISGPHSEIQEGVPQWSADMGLSYSDFLTGLNMKMSQSPHDHNAKLNPDAAYHAYHKYKNKSAARVQGRRSQRATRSGRHDRDYESDIGTRASGYESEVSRRSEPAGLSKNRLAAVSQNVLGRTGQRRSRTRGFRPGGYESDSGFQLIQPVPTNTQTKHPSVPGPDVNRNSHHLSNQNFSSASKPVCKRTTIGNDELYGPTQSVSVLSSTPSKNLSSSTSTSMTSHRQDFSNSVNISSTNSRTSLNQSRVTGSDSPYSTGIPVNDSKSQPSTEKDDENYRLKLHSTAIRMRQNSSADTSISNQEDLPLLPKFSPPCTSSPDYLSPQKSHSTSRVSVAHSDASSSHNTFQVSGTGAGDSLNRPKTLPLTDTTHTNTPRRSQQYQKQNIYAAGEVNAHGFSPGNMSHHGTPPQSTTNYDKDVAVYKQQDPLSQVSSSTDSGYGHAHQFDRNSASDTTSRLSALSPGSAPSTAFCSPMSTTTGNSPNSTPYSKVASPHPSELSSTPITATPTPGQTPSGRRSCSNPTSPSTVFKTTITKNPGLGFSIAGGLGSAGNPFKPADAGIFITKVQGDGPAVGSLQVSDKILQVNGVDFTQVQHSRAVDVLRKSNQSVAMLLERFH